MSENPGRNDPCFCGSNKKYKNCHLKLFRPTESFNCRISALDTIRFENRIPPGSGIEVGDATVYYGDPHPWDNVITSLLHPFESAGWDEKKRWENRIKKRISKLRYKIEVLRFNIETFKFLERRTINEYQDFIIANHTMSKVYNDQNLISNVESFLFQSKSCLDVFAQIIAYSFKFEISKYQDNGKALLKILNKTSTQHEQDKNRIFELIETSIPWVKELVEMRDDVTHFSDLEGLSCFLIKKCSETDLTVKVYFPAMPSGVRVSVYMDKIWYNIYSLINECRPILIRVAKNVNP